MICLNIGGALGPCDTAVSWFPFIHVVSFLGLTPVAYMHAYDHLSHCMLETCTICHLYLCWEMTMLCLFPLLVQISIYLGDIKRMFGTNKTISTCKILLFYPYLVATQITFEIKTFWMHNLIFNRNIFLKSTTIFVKLCSHPS